MVQAGTPLAALQEMGGWETTAMVQRYAHLSTEHLAKHASAIDRVFDQNGTKTVHEVKTALDIKVARTM
jgi:site-specific recombinase XerC